MNARWFVCFSLGPVGVSTCKESLVVVVVVVGGMRHVLVPEPTMGIFHDHHVTSFVVLPGTVQQVRAMFFHVAYLK